MKDELKHILETTAGWKRKACLKKLGHTEASARAFLIEESKPKVVVKPKVTRKVPKRGNK